MAADQQTRILLLLQKAALSNDGICKGRFYQLSPPITQPGARVFELQAAGWTIESVPCNQHYHNNDGMKMYRLLPDDATLF